MNSRDGVLPGRRERPQRVCEESTRGPPTLGARAHARRVGSWDHAGPPGTLTHSRQVAELKAPLQRPLPGHQGLR